MDGKKNGPTIREGYGNHLARFLILFVCLSSIATAEKVSERQKVILLIHRIEELRDAVFIRDDVEISCKEAAAWMRKDPALLGDEDTAAIFFIHRVSSSLDTKKPFWSRFRDGRTIKVEDFLLAELKKTDRIPKGAE